MRSFAAIFLLLSICYQLVAKMGVIVWYETNRDYVATTLCENKDKPEQQCAGKCYLKKQLAKIDSETEKKESEPVKKHKTELPEYTVSTNLQYLFLSYQDVISHKTIFINHYSFQNNSSVFHPPPFC